MGEREAEPADEQLKEAFVSQASSAGERFLSRFLTQGRP